MLGRDDQQKGSDLREKRRTRLPEMPSPRVPDFSLGSLRNQDDDAEDNVA